MEGEQSRLSERKIIVITAILIVMACFFAIYLRLFTQKELWYEMFAAVLGVVITAIITMILLRGQSNNDVERERASKVFEEKLRIYQEYLQTLYEVIQDGGLSDQEKLKLEFQTSYVAMHCSPKYIADVSVAVKNIIEINCSEDSESNSSNAIQDSGTPEPTLENLFRIVEAFRRDLYGSSFSFNSDYKNNTLSNFSNAYRNAKDVYEKADDKEHLIVDLNVLSGSLFGKPYSDIDKNCETKAELHKEDQIKIDNQIKNINDPDWLNAVQQWQNLGWKVSEPSSEEDSITLWNDFENQPWEIKIYYWDGNYIIQAVYDWRKESADFAKPLKWDRGGRRFKGCWWANLPDMYANMSEGSLAEKFLNDKELRNYVIKNFNELRIAIESYHKSEIIKNKIKCPEGTTLSIWYWKVIAADYYREDEGSLYLDIYENENEKTIHITLGNREKNKEMLYKTLERMGVKNYEYNENQTVVLEKIPLSNGVDSIAESISGWLEKMAK